MSTPIARPSATPKKRRQEASRPHGDGNQEEPKKRARRAPRSDLATSLSLRNESPIPRVQSDIVGAKPYPKPKRPRYSSKKLLESKDDSTGGASKRHKDSMQTSTSPIESNDDLGEHQPESTSVQALKLRIADLEQERDEFRDKCKKKEEKLEKKGARLLILEARDTTNDPEETRVGDSTLIGDFTEEDLLVDDGLWSGRPLKVEEHQMPQALEETDDPFATPDCLREEQPVPDSASSTNPTKDSRKQGQDKVSLLEARNLSLEKDLEDARATAQRAEENLEELATRQYEQIDALQKDNVDLKRNLEEDYQKKVSALEHDARDHSEQIEAMTHKGNKLYLRCLILQDEITRLREENSDRNDLQDQVTEARSALKKARGDAAQERKILKDQVISLKADLARLDKVEDAKRRLETEKDERNDKMAALQTEIAGLRESGKQHENILKQHEDLLKQLRHAEAKSDSLGNKIGELVQANNNALKEEKAKHTKELQSLEDTAEFFRMAYGKASSALIQKASVVNDLKAELDALKISLETKEQEAVIQHNKLQAFEAERVSLTNQKTAHVGQMQKLEAKVKEMHHDLKAKDEQIDELQNRLGSAEGQVISLNATNRGYKVSLDTHKAHIALDKKLRETLDQDLQQLEDTISQYKDHEQKVEQFVSFVKSQICRKIEDEESREPDLEKTTETASMETLQKIVEWKFDALECELHWYQQFVEKKQKQLEDRDVRLRKLAALSRIFAR